MPQAYGRDKSQITVFLRTENNEYEGKGKNEKHFGVFILSAKKKSIKKQHYFFLP